MPLLFILTTLLSDHFVLKFRIIKVETLGILSSSDNYKLFNSYDVKFTLQEYGV